MIKIEPEDESQTVTESQPPSSVAQSSIMVSSVYNDGGCSVQMASVCPTTPGEAIGQGPKVLQFFYQNPVDDIKIGFPPVRVTTEEEVNCVVALVTEKAEEYNRRNHLAYKGKQVQYYSSAVQARSILDQEIVRHIEKCFTKKGMKESRTDRKKRSYPKRKEIIKVPQDYFKVKEYNDYEDEEIEEEADNVEEYNPTETEMKSVLEAKVFGGQMPITIRRSKPPRKGVSERKGRGGRNENINKNVPKTLVLGAVEYMLGNKVCDGEKKQTQLNLSSLFNKRGRKKKKKVDIDAFSDEDDYKAPNNIMKSGINLKGQRKSTRINMKYQEEDDNEAVSRNLSKESDDKVNLIAAKSLKMEKKQSISKNKL